MAKRRSRDRAIARRLCVGVAWYDSEQWAKLKQSAADADNLDNSFDAWKLNAENVERELRQKGIKIQRVHVNIDALIAWCQKHNLPNNGESRSKYAAELVSGGEA